MPPTASVLIPACNRPDLLRRCLQCLRPEAQGLPLSSGAVDQSGGDSYEIIVSDDSASEETLAEVRREFPWVRFVRGPRRGPASNRNCAARHASGKWLLFTDDDCEPEPTWIRAFLSAVRDNVEVYEGKTTSGPPFPHPDWTAPENLQGGYLWSCNFMVSKQLFSALGGFDEKFPYPHMEDVDFRWRLEAGNHPWIFVDNAVVFHPPRPRVRGKKALRAYSSYFYFAKKHGVTPAGCGLSLINQARNAWHDLKAPAPLGARVRHFLWTLWETLLILRHWRTWEKSVSDKIK